MQPDIARRRSRDLSREGELKARGMEQLGEGVGEVDRSFTGCSQKQASSLDPKKHKLHSSERGWRTALSTHTEPLRMSDRDRLLQILVETLSFKSSTTDSFLLASGVRSKYYIDCKVALSYPEARELVGKLIYQKIRSTGIQAVGGLIIGAYPIAIAVSDTAYRTHARVIRAFVIRKEAKEHGRKKVIEGDIRAGSKVLIVDDVITSSKSTIEAIEKSRNEGLEVVQAIALIDREEQNGRQLIEATGVPFEALCTLNDLIREQNSEDVLEKR